MVEAETYIVREAVCRPIDVYAFLDVYKAGEDESEGQWVAIEKAHFYSLNPQAGTSISARILNDEVQLPSTRVEEVAKKMLVDDVLKRPKVLKHAI